MQNITSESGFAKGRTKNKGRTSMPSWKKIPPRRRAMGTRLRIRLDHPWPRAFRRSKQQRLWQSPARSRSEGPEVIMMDEPARDHSVATAKVRGTLIQSLRRTVHARDRQRTKTCSRRGAVVLGQDGVLRQGAGCIEFAGQTRTNLHATPPIPKTEAYVSGAAFG